MDEKTEVATCDEGEESSYIASDFENPVLLTSKNSKRSMNTTLPYNYNLNDENSKPK